ncbi:hypothetical protein [Rhodococcus sp. UNC363MFTsu5.1]|uniref:hypothetical protein n=1 Tax=Rhodococcus sp. UNC363MFTsu5.1 TaxID=1449069 RepID=UPI000483A5F6|nr:hypothetical protein [Rhodococcus sp. UNC363MFTsu5.1]
MTHTTELDDGTLARLPIGQWTDAAHAEVISFIRRWLAARGLTRDATGRLRLAEPGRQAHALVKEQLPGVRREIHAGIDDADYVTTVKVLRRMILNVGGEEALARYPI